LVREGSKLYCRWADDICAGTTCNYVICVRGRLLANGVCGLTVKRKTIEEEKMEEEKIPIRIKSKTLQRLGGDEIL